MSRDVSHNTRIEPNRKWFVPTRTVGQDQLDTFRTAMSSAIKNPYTVLLKPGRIPFGLLSESEKTSRVKILETESYDQTFGPKSQRKRPKISYEGLEGMMETATAQGESYDSTKDRNIAVDRGVFYDGKRDDMFDKGHSKRLWGELYKVLDSSDVVIQVLDARDPQGTRSLHLERHLAKNARHKHLVLVLNKCDLVPPWVSARWAHVLSREHPTIAFHASLTHPFGKGALIMLLRQFANLHSDKKQISVGFVGYPNVGKSSIINTLRSKKVCKVAPIPGETKIWQYISMTRKISLIDCPGVVPPENHSETEIVLRGVVRVENLKVPEQFIPAVLAKVKPEYVARTYGISQWNDPEDFMAKLAEKTGRLLKKGEPDTTTVAKTVLYDWARGKLPYFTLPELKDMPAGPTPSTQTTEKEVKKEEEKEGEEEEEEDELKSLLKETTAQIGAVKQNFKNIGVKLEYDDADMEGEENEMQEGDEPDWDELYENTKGEDDDDDLPEGLKEEEVEDGEEGEESGEEMEIKEEDEEEEVVEIKEEEDEEEGDEGVKEEEEGKEEEVGNKRKNTNNDTKNNTKNNARGSPSPNKNKDNKKRKFDGDEEDHAAKKVRTKISRKEKRAGVHFYETANVKNRNRKRKNVVSRSKRHQTL
eukprot:Phypoly_transcript_04201.p1 GENE.Phypoly_transcript_04201~~Phypoly_transcript_04201.p1  ORF type:complete len:741 (-),score=241.72 Phypoly_transcript_04201:18-1958(-)